MIFDTDILIELLQKSEAAAFLIDSVPLERRNVCVISYLELVRGCRSRENLKRIQQFVRNRFTEVIGVTREMNALAVRIMDEYALSHRPGAVDVLIAAAALDRREPLVTGNFKHYRFIPGLEVKQFRP
ncbi:MAG TPA: PIN domain-containing protein [Terriglobia bacterium]|nr:PIN domain-containing protein [Terriglobia bacterium]